MKNRATWMIPLLVMTAHAAHGQPYMVSGIIEHGGAGQVYLASYYGDRFSMVDSIATETGSFYFVLDDLDAVGVYRIMFSDEVDGIRSEYQFVEFIFNRETFEIIVTPGAHGPEAHFEGSRENQLYSEFMTGELEYESEIMQIYPRLFALKAADPGYDQTVRRYDSLQKKRNRLIDSLAAVHPDLYATRIMNAFRSPFVPGSMTHRERIDTLKICFFDHAAIDDPLLLNAPVYTFRIIDFLSLFKVDTLPKDQMEVQFMEAVDRIMVNVSDDSDLRSFVVEFLLEGFELLDMEQVQVHLAEHYLDESCESDIVELVLSRMEGIKRMAIGEQAPDFVIRDLQGINHQLSRIGHPYVLVLFWSSTCDHCRQMLPELHDWYLHENNADLEVVAISIDTSYSSFEFFNSHLEPAWISTFDPLGWNGRVPGEYYIYATPTLFLLDRDRTILARPSSFRAFLRAVKKLEP